jgi:hypothetical protein
MAGLFGDHQIPVDGLAENQSSDEVVINGSSLFKPNRLAFSVLLPTHGKYAGGNESFEKSTDADSPAFYFYLEVPLAERDALKEKDRRRIAIRQGARLNAFYAANS